MYYENLCLVLVDGVVLTFLEYTVPGTDPLGIVFESIMTVCIHAAIFLHVYVGVYVYICDVCMCDVCVCVALVKHPYLMQGLLASCFKEIP